MKTKNRNTDKKSTPFLKWTGGKRWLAKEINALLPNNYKRYIEPFLGGGALFFHLNPKLATLSDLNDDLINTYKQVRDNVEEVILKLSRYEICPNVYKKIRSSNPRLSFTKAVKFLYLNRTAFNGIYRVNREGKFNVPFGCKEGTIICDEDLLRNSSKLLRNKKLQISDFESVINGAEVGDLVYADPPYTTKHNNNGFRRYNETIFSWDDQERLADCCIRATKRGVHVFVSNAYHDPIIELYDGFKVKSVSRHSVISGDPEGRSEVKESLIYNCK